MVQLVVNLLFGQSGIVFIDYFLGILIFLVFPVTIGKFTLFVVFDKLLSKHEYPWWVKILIFWCVGNVMLNIASIFTVLTQGSFMLIVLIEYVILYLIFLRFTESEAHHTPVNILSFLKKHRSVILSAGLFGLLNGLYFVWWAARMEFTSFNTDSLQNAQLANLFRVGKVYNLIATTISPQYNQVDYTTIITPNYAVATSFFDFREILYVMSFVEILISCFVFLSRFCLLREFKIPIFTSAILSAISTMIVFSGLYMSGTYYNQQVLVYCFPALLYFLKDRRFFSGFALFLLLIPFHFTMTAFVILYSGSFIFFLYMEMSKRIGKIRIILHLEKFVMVAVFMVLLYFEGLFTFETNYKIVNFFLAIFDGKPQYANTIGLYSNISIMQIMFHGVGPLVVGILIATPVAWLFTRDQVSRWVFFLVTLQLFILIIPFPVASRTFVLFQLILVLDIYFVLKALFGSREKLINTALVLVMVSNVLWNTSVRANDLDISGNSWQRPFLSREYQDFLKVAAQEVQNQNIQPKDYKLISEFFMKQHFESIAYKTDDNGVYEEDRDERAAMFDFLNNYRTDACQYHARPYLLYLLNERTFKWIRIPKELAKSSSFSVWWSNPTSLTERYWMDTYTPKVDGEIIKDVHTDPNNRYILIKCKSMQYDKQYDKK